MALDSSFLLRATAYELQSQLSSGAITSKQLVEASLDQIAKHDGYLHAVISISPKEILTRIAKDLDDERAAGKLRGPLHGLPILVKDNIATHPILGMDTTAGSIALAGSRPSQNAAVIERLVNAGSIIIAKSNLSEFGWYKTTKAPAGWSPAGGQTQSAYVRGGFRTDDSGAGHSNPGGSSSGSAVGVSAGYTSISIGTETLGSLILPANRAALFSLKPTIGLVSASGIVPISNLCDSAGPMAKTALDLATMMDVLVDSSSTARPDGGYRASLTGSWEGLRIGVLKSDLDFSNKGEWRKSAAEADEQEKIDTLLAYHVIRDHAIHFRENVNLISPDEFTVNGVDVLSQIFRATFEQELEMYLANLDSSRVRTLAELIQFNKDHADVELPPECPGQEFLEEALTCSISPPDLQCLIDHMRRVARTEGIDKTFAEHNIDILIGHAEGVLTTFAAAAGYPIASLPLGVLNYNGRPHGVAAIAKAHHEHLLIQLMSVWEDTFPRRRPPPLLVEGSELPWSI